MAEDVQKSIVLDFTYTTDTYDQFTQAEVYGKVITKMAEANKDIVVLTSDMTRSNKTGDFKKTFPERFFNFGIAEANMFAASAGMAANSSGVYPKREDTVPFTDSILRPGIVTVNTVSARESWSTCSTSMTRVSVSQCMHCAGFGAPSPRACLAPKC